MRLFVTFVFTLAPVFAGSISADELPGSLPAELRPFLSQNCTDCHSGDVTEGGLNLSELRFDLGDHSTLERWVRIADRVESGEMPPADSGYTVPNSDRARFAKALGDRVRVHERYENAMAGRVRAKKLTALQLERSLWDLLGIDVPLANLLPEEARTHGFNTVAEGQSVSHFDLDNHLTVVDAALDEAFRRATTADDTWTREMSARDLSRRNPKSRNRDPEFFQNRAVVWSSNLVFYGRISSTRAREDGWYRFTFDVSSLKQPEYGVWCTVRTGECRSSAPLMNEVAIFRATEQPTTVTVEAWLPKNHMFEVRPYDSRLKKGRTPGGQVGAGEMQPQNVPGIGLHKATLSKIHRGPSDEEVRSLLFGNLDVQIDRKKQTATLASEQPAADLERLMHQFANRAFRRPVENAEIRPYIDLAVDRLHAGDPLLTALRDGYRSLLCSPRFLYFTEKPGRLDDYAIASRLSYFLWNAPPDEELLRLAHAEQLRDPAVLRRQVNRMLGGEHARQFVEDFAHQWLDLKEIDFTQPDRRLYRSFDLIVQASLLEETHTYLHTLLENDLSVSHLIDSNFTFLNERLAAHYGTDLSDSGELERVALSPKSPRGGLLTQGSILKVTANGTTTSPVLRGIWVSERLLGRNIPEPPQNVPAVEPDIRGAKTIREQLAAHKSDSSCAGCHRNIDPPGFALENFDPVGRWRSTYPKPRNNRKAKPLPIDASARLPDGKSFQNVVEFQQIFASRKADLARNLASQLVTYGTGAPVSYADRQVIDRIVEDTAGSDYGFRSVLHAVVQSELFLKK